MWQVFHISCCSKGTPRQVWEGFWCSSRLPRSIINKKGPTPSIKVASVAQTRPAKRQKTSTRHSTFKDKIKLKKYSREEYDSMVTASGKLYKLWKKSRLIKCKNTSENSEALEAGLAAHEGKTKEQWNKSLLTDEKPKANNRNYPALDRKKSSTRQSHANTWWIGLS